MECVEDVQLMKELQEIKESTEESFSTGLTLRELSVFFVKHYTGVPFFFATNDLLIHKLCNSLHV